MSDLHWAAAFLLAVGATARITRLVTWDKYPPAARVRIWWDTLTHDGPWSFLVHCGYCFAMWAAMLVVGTAALSYGLSGQIHWTWWLASAWLTASYLAAILMAYDGDDDPGD